MLDELSHIAAVGFDLDGTLYVPTEEINMAIRRTAYRVAADSLNITVEEAALQFEEIYAHTHKGHKTLAIMGVENGKEAMSCALKESGNVVAGMLEHDSDLVSLMNDLYFAYPLYMITNSPQEIAIGKLDALGVPLDIFGVAIYVEGPLRRGDGSAFFYVSDRLGVNLENMMFVGDRHKTDIAPAVQLGLTTAIVNGESPDAHYRLDTIYELGGLLL